MPNDKLLAKLDEVKVRSDETRKILIGILCERQPWSLRVPANPDDPDLRVADMHEALAKMERLIRAQARVIEAQDALEAAPGPAEYQHAKAWVEEAKAAITQTEKEFVG